MDSLFKLFFPAALLLLATGVEKTRADAMVTGSIFCDQCKDGQMTLFDYPLSGAKVVVGCPGSDGQLTVRKEGVTNWFGTYRMRFEGAPDLSGCFAQVASSSSGCAAAGGPARALKLYFRMFDMEMYAVDALLSQPAQPMSFCPRSASPLPAPGSPAISLPPPLPFLEASACPYENWTMPEYKCYWKVVAPDTKVAVAFGLAAARQYGTDMNLWEGLQGRGDAYRTLLREATTALLNSYNSIQFRYPPLSVVAHMNWALMGSPQRALITALRFKRANLGGPHVVCKFNPCT